MLTVFIVIVLLFCILTLLVIVLYIMFTQRCVSILQHHARAIVMQHLFMSLRTGATALSSSLVQHSHSPRATLLHSHHAYSVARALALLHHILIALSYCPAACLYVIVHTRCDIVLLLPSRILSSLSCSSQLLSLGPVPTHRANLRFRTRLSSD
jgi:hypothetical protein